MLFFANTNHGATGSRAPGGRGVVCTDELRRCRAFDAPAGRFFDPARRESPARPEEVESLRQISRRSIRQREGGTQPRTLSLLSDPVFVVEGTGDQLIHGGQYVSLAPGQWIEVEIRVSAHGPGARAEIEHVLRLTTADKLSSWSVPLADGQTLHLRYTYAPEEAMNEVGARSIARLAAGDRIELRFEIARMTLRSDGQAPAPGIQIHRRELLPRRARAGTAPP